MPIIYEKASAEFHLYNDTLSYILKVLPDGQIGNLYYGEKIRHRADYSYLFEGAMRPLAVYTKENDYFYSQQHTRMEYPTLGNGDFREPAFTVLQENGSRIARFAYVSHEITKGKPTLPGLPATFADEKDATTLSILLRDDVMGMEMVLRYTIFEHEGALTRNVTFKNIGNDTLTLERVLSMNLDLPDADYEMLHLSGAWSRERHIVVSSIEKGARRVSSMRGISSSEANPFIALKRKDATEKSGEVMGFCLVYSGNHLEQAEEDSFGGLRVSVGINPECFKWRLAKGEEFISPESILVYSKSGLNGMSRIFHNLVRYHLIRGRRSRMERPILINNWEATGAAFTEEQILKIADEAKALGIEMFVLDDGWFGKRDDDTSGLGDWYVKNTEKLPNGIEGLAKKIQDKGLDFGLWIEPEMVNKDSDLYRAHPDWLLQAPGREPYPCRNQYVLDMTRQEVVDYIYEAIAKILRSGRISYIKWDMNRPLTDCYSGAAKANEQGMVYHRYVLSVYALYEKLTSEFPDILFESCSSGGARFDAGILYYAPQTWTSDDTDAVERLKIQYGTSMIYPLMTMGAHVSAVPNQQVGRITPIETRGNVAQFGLLGYELDLGTLTDSEKAIVKEQVAFAKEYRKLIMYGTFYRLLSPFESNETAWMVVSQDQSEALVGYYRVLGKPNEGWIRLRLDGLDENADYEVDGVVYGGDELMQAGLAIDKSKLPGGGCDFSSRIFKIQKVQ